MNFEEKFIDKLTKCNSPLGEYELHLTKDELREIIDAYNMWCSQQCICKTDKVIPVNTNLNKVACRKCGLYLGDIKK